MLVKIRAMLVLYLVSLQSHVHGKPGYAECKPAGSTFHRLTPLTDVYGYLVNASKATTEIQLVLAAGEYNMACDFDTRLSALIGLRFLSIVGAGADLTHIRAGVCNKRCFDGYKDCKQPAPTKRRFFTVGNGTCLHLQNLAMSGGDATGYRYPAGGLANDENWGGAILVRPLGSTNIHGVKLTKCRANDGGAMFLQSLANVSLASMCIAENNATGEAAGGDGGGIVASRLSLLGMQDMIFANNTAHQGGGGAQVQLTLVTLAKNLTFLHNKAQTGGGAQLIPRGDLQSDIANFNESYPPNFMKQFIQLATAKGFAQYPALPTICERCSFTENTALVNAGGLQVLAYGNPLSNSSTTVLSKLLVDRNTALTLAGGMQIASLENRGEVVSFNKEFTVRLEDSVVQNNNAKGEGLVGGNGGGLNLESGNISIVRSTISSNTCGHRGAGIYISSSPFVAGLAVLVHVVGSEIAKNKALGQSSLGGGVAVFTPEIGTPTNLQIKSCPRPIAAGTKPTACNSARPWVDGYACSCTLVENVYRQWNYSIEVKFSDSKVLWNEAKFGGGFHVQNANVSFSNGRISSNHGVQRGAALYLNDGTASLSLSDVAVDANTGNPGNLGLQLYSEAAGALTITGKSKILLTGNQSELNVALGGGEIRVGPLTEIRCPVGYAFTTDTRHGTPIKQTFGPGSFEWSISCNDKHCIEVCQDSTDYKACHATDAACWRQLPRADNYTYLKCLRKCHASACSQCTDDSGCSTALRNLTLFDDTFHAKYYGYAFFSPCATCDNAQLMQPTMLTQSLSVGCVPCPSKKYRSYGASVVGNANGLLEHVSSDCDRCMCAYSNSYVQKCDKSRSQVKCAPCPTNARCDGVYMRAKAGFWAPSADARASSAPHFTRCTAVDACASAVYCPTDFIGCTNSSRGTDIRCHGHRNSSSALCSECSRGYSAVFGGGVGGNCVPDSECNTARWLVPLGLFMLLCFAWFLTWTTNDAESALTRVVFYYFQIFPIVAPLQTEGLGKETVLAVFNLRLQAGTGGDSVCLMPGFNALTEVLLNLGTPVMLGALIFLALPAEQAFSWLGSRIWRPCKSGGDSYDQTGRADSSIGESQTERRQQFQSMPALIDDVQIRRQHTFEDGSNDCVSSATQLLLPSRRSRSAMSFAEAEAGADQFSPSGEGELNDTDGRSNMVPRITYKWRYRRCKALVNVLLLTYSTMTEQLMLLCYCVTVPALPSGAGSTNRLAIAAEKVQCYQSWQYLVIILIAFGVAPLPFLLFWWIERRRKHQRAEKRMEVELSSPYSPELMALFNVLRGPFQKSSSTTTTTAAATTITDTLSRNWELFILFRRFVLLAIYSFFSTHSNYFWRATAMAICNVAILVLHIACRPFKHKIEQNLETVSLSLLVLLSLLNFRQAIEDDLGVDAGQRPQDVSVQNLQVALLLGPALFCSIVLFCKCVMCVSSLIRSDVIGD
jgi:hypothetical protein